MQIDSLVTAPKNDTTQFEFRWHESSLKILSKHLPCLHNYTKPKLFPSRITKATVTYHSTNNAQENQKEVIHIQIGMRMPVAQDTILPLD